MSHLAEIVLPHGASTVKIGDIPDLIADAIYPATNSSAQVVSGLHKQLLAPDGMPLPGLHPLTSDPLHDYNTPELRLLEAVFIAAPGEKISPMTDWAWLNNAWIFLPALELPIAEAEWSEYEAALQTRMGEEHGWVLVPEWSTLATAMAMLRLRAQIAHRNELARALESGELKPRSTATRAPLGIDEDRRRGVITVDELTKYVNRFHIAVSFEAEEAPYGAALNEEGRPAAGDFDDAVVVQRAGRRELPLTAKDMLGGLTSQILRGLLAAAPGEIRHQYGMSPDDAAISLHCCDIAELLHWDEIALLDAATAGATEEQRLMWGLQNRNALKRRISLAMKAERTSETMSPAQGVLFLRRAGIDVFHELLDAVATLTLRECTDEAVLTYRELKRISEPQSETEADSEESDAPVTRASAQREAILVALRKLGHDPLRMPKAEAGKPGIKADLRKQLTKARKDIFISIGVFDDAWQRLRDQGDIRDA
jgi:hypothetical protein